MMFLRTRARLGAAVIVAGVLAAIAAACGGGPPTPPTPQGPRVNAPVASSPTGGAEVTSLRPELTVDNATATQTGERTYEFQVSSTADFSGVAPATLIAKTGIPENSSGKTSYMLEEDLKIASSYFWRARATQAGVVSTYSTAASFKTRSKAPPVVRVSLPKDRADADETMVALAIVQSADTPINQLTYEWTADKGTITGTGPQATWQAPRAAAPGPIELKVTVTDKYTVTNPDGSTTQAENKVTASGKVTYNDSFKEIRELSLDFIGDFANSNNSPSFCVRNFSDSCGGKAEEFGDIEANRARVTILSADYAIRDIFFNSDKTIADVVARCNFVSRVKATGATEVATGSCLLQAIYEKSNWYLCDSKYGAASPFSAWFWGAARQEP